MSKYDHHDKETLIRLLERRDAERQLGLVWERENEEVRDRAINEDFVAFDLDEKLGLMSGCSLRAVSILHACAGSDGSGVSTVRRPSSAED